MTITRHDDALRTGGSIIILITPAQLVVGSRSATMLCDCMSVYESNHEHLERSTIKMPCGTVAGLWCRLNYRPVTRAYTLTGPVILDEWH